MRTEGLRKLKELQKLERESQARRLESRRAGLSVLVARGAGLCGMDLSGLSDPFCVILWNGAEIGRTTVRHGTRDPIWAGEGDGGGGSGNVGADTGFALTFFIPEEEDWGEEEWPSMRLEVSWWKSLGVVAGLRVRVDKYCRLVGGLGGCTVREGRTGGWMTESHLRQANRPLAGRSRGVNPREKHEGGEGYGYPAALVFV